VTPGPTASDSPHVAPAVPGDVLTRTNKFAIVYRVQEAKRADTRARRIQQYVEMLERGDTPHPQTQKPGPD